MIRLLGLRGCLSAASFRASDSRRFTRHVAAGALLGFAAAALLCLSAAFVVAAEPVRGPSAGSGTASPPDSSAIDSHLLRSYLPKDDLGIPRFLAEHPGADGEGVIVAILDTGVDLDHAGLLQTPRGERKILDVFDATDNGLCDLPVSTQVTGDTLLGLSGRLLRLGAHRSEGAPCRLGRLSAREIFPEALTARLLRERKEERQRRIADWENRVSAAEGAEPELDEEAKEDSLPPPDREHSYRDVRREADRDFEDPGPVYDLVALKRDDGWALLIDTDADGDLGEETLLRPYRVRGDIALFPPPASLSIALSSISEDGYRVSLFFDEGGHGTHVAGIVGAYYGPEDPLNGLAPGVRFLAVKVGNGRFGGSSSHNSIPKALAWAVKQGAMVANLSFGGTSYFGDGREITSSFFDEMVQNHGIFITVSAGNEGPGLSTVGSPGNARRAFTFGAAISPYQIMASYGGLVGAPGLNPHARPGEGLRLFQFSSRGPLTNGSPGVDLVTPGAAVSPLPTWFLTRNENWNGTSMAAPQGAGCLALLLSAALKDTLPVSPARLDRALKATARPLEGVTEVEQGAGLVQLPAAYRALRELSLAFPVHPPAAADSVQVPGIGVPATRDPVTFWKIEVENATGVGEGYYERDLTEREPYFKSFTIRPDLPSLGANPLKDRFQRVLRLESTVPWMEAPPQVAVPASGVTIRVKYDPTKMRPGLNVGRIRLLDLAQSGPGGHTRQVAAPGSETELLATVILPEECAAPDYKMQREVPLAPGERSAVYVRVPEGATRVRLRLREDLADPANIYNLAATALSLLHPPSTLRDVVAFALRRDEERTFYQRVEAGTTLEIALFSRWTNVSAGQALLTLEFDGLAGPLACGSPAQLGGVQREEERWGEPPLTLPAGKSVLRVPVRSTLKPVRLSVSATVTGRAEPLDLEWDLRPDSLFRLPLEGRNALIMLGRGWLRLDPEEAVTCDLQSSPELEDALDDAFCRLFDPNGHLADARYISSGPFRLQAPKDGPSPGWYRMEISVFLRGRDFLPGFSLFAPEIVREKSRGRLTLYPQAVAAQQQAADSSWSVTLLRGTDRALGLRVEGLPEGADLADRPFTGRIEFDDRTDAPPLLRVPLRLGQGPLSVDPQEQLRSARGRLEEQARRALTLPPGLVENKLKELLDDLDEEGAIARGCRGEKYETSPEAFDRVLLRFDLWRRQGGDTAEAIRTMAGLLDEAERLRREIEQEQERKEKSAREKNEPSSYTAVPGIAARTTGDRDRQGAILLRRAELDLIQGDLKQARLMLDRAAAFSFGREDETPVLGELLYREGHLLEALRPVRAARKADPFNSLAAEMEVSLYLDLGWVDLAGEELARWLDLYPRESESFLALARRLRGTPKASESRTESF